MWMHRKRNLNTWIKGLKTLLFTFFIFLIWAHRFIFLVLKMPISYFWYRLINFNIFTYYFYLINRFFKNFKNSLRSGNRSWNGECCLSHFNIAVSSSIKYTFTFFILLINFKLFITKFHYIFRDSWFHY